MVGSDHDWSLLDGWWESYVSSDQSVLTDADTLVLDTGALDSQWSNLDDWWSAYISTDRSTLVDDTATMLNNRPLVNSWADLDDWWQTYSEARQDDIYELLNTLEMAEDTWAAGPSQFDTDPLSVDWQTAQGSTGPIRLSREEDWSHALAHLLRSGPSELIDELLDSPHTGTPDSVETEAHLPGGSETTRYEDILVTLPSGGISIEVKIGDRNLKKTVETAALVERHYAGEWTHVLLLPAYQHSDLRDTFGDALAQSEEGPPVITTTPFDDREIQVQILNWQEISAALRAILQRHNDLSPHWAASAYVVCTLIEQRILGFVPKPTLKQLAATDGIVHDDVSLAISIGDIESQISYLQATTQETHHG